MFINIELNAELSSIIILQASGISETLSSWQSHSKAGCTHRHPSEPFKQQSVNLSFSEFPFLLRHCGSAPYQPTPSLPILILSTSWLPQFDPDTSLCTLQIHYHTHIKNGWSVKGREKRKEERKAGRKQGRTDLHVIILWQMTTNLKVSWTL